MKYFELDKKEEQILKDFEKGNFSSVKNKKEDIKNYVQIAKNTLSKTKSVNIRISEKNLLKIKALAAKEGLPYQTLISSFLHKLV